MRHEFEDIERDAVTTQTAQPHSTQYIIYRLYIIKHRKITKQCIFTNCKIWNEFEDILSGRRWRHRQRSFTASPPPAYLLSGDPPLEHAVQQQTAVRQEGLVARGHPCGGLEINVAMVSGENERREPWREGRVARDHPSGGLRIEVGRVLSGLGWDEG